MIQNCLYGSASPTLYEPLTHCLRGNHMWVVFQLKPDSPKTQTFENERVYTYPERLICLYLLGAQKDYGWGYKAVEETMGPAETNCPLSYLDMVPDPGGYSTDWRERVRKHHQRRLDGAATARKLAVGTCVQVVNADGSPNSKVPQVTITRVGRQIRGVYNGCAYRVPRKMIGPVVPTLKEHQEQPI